MQYKLLKSIDHDSIDIGDIFDANNNDFLYKISGCQIGTNDKKIRFCTDYELGTFYK